MSPSAPRPVRTRLGGALVVSLSLLTQGCIASTLLLRVRADGSGQPIITTSLFESSVRAFDTLLGSRGAPMPRPPNVEEELPAPGQTELDRQFGTPVRIVSTRLDKAPDGGVRTTTIAFEDVTKLQMLFPPIFLGPGMHGFGFGFSGMTELPLMTFSIKPHENGNRLLVVKLPNPRVSTQPNAPVTRFETDSPDERLIKQAIKNMAL